EHHPPSHHSASLRFIPEFHRVSVEVLGSGLLVDLDQPANEGTRRSRFAAEGDAGGFETLSSNDRAADLGFGGKDRPSGLNHAAHFHGGPGQELADRDLASDLEGAGEFEGPANGESAADLDVPALAVSANAPKASDFEVLEREVPVGAHHPAGFDIAPLRHVVELRDPADLEATELDRSVGTEFAANLDGTPHHAACEADDPADFERFEFDVSQVHGAPGIHGFRRQPPRETELSADRDLLR